MSNTKRHGVDELSISQMIFAIIFLLLSFFTGKIAGEIFSILSIYLLITSTFRIFSKNELQRNSENYTFMARVLNPLKKKFHKKKKRDKNYKYIKCKKCGQELRIPKGKGKIKVKCPKCGNEFEERT